MFSPNQDGINDLFMPRYTYVEWVEWAVYSRWGQKVFETSDPTLGWDGKFQGRDVSDGVYFIELRAGNHRDPTVIRLNGSIHLIR
jgi:gliding motility-associated-like protein